MDVIKVELSNNYCPGIFPRGDVYGEVCRRRVTDKLLWSFLISSSLTRKTPGLTPFQVVRVSPTYV